MELIDKKNSSFSDTHSLYRVMTLLTFLLITYFISRWNYLVFHTGIELISIIVALSISVIAINTHKYSGNDFFMLLGIAYTFIALTDLLHTLAYYEMGVFPGDTRNLSAQLWVAARYIESISFLISAIYIKKKLPVAKTALCYVAAFIILMTSIFYWDNFPQCFHPDMGLTSFKIYSEYFISIVIAGALVMVIRNKGFFQHTSIFYNIILAYSATIAAELMFTTYTRVDGIANLLGHHLKFLSFYLIYLAMVEINLILPYQQLARSNQQLIQEIAKRETEEAKRIQYEQELMKISKLDSIATIAGGIAHDFKNLLTVILGNVTLIEIKKIDDPKLNNNIAHIKEAALQASELTNRLVSFSKGGQAVKSRINISPLVQNTVELALSGTSIRPNFYIDNLNLAVKADEGQIKQVVNNIVINAVQAMPWGGLLSVKICNTVLDPDSVNIPVSPGDYVLISFTDQGVGITDDDLAHVFEPFFTTKPSGHGLGLPTSFTIVTNHGGYITVSSRPGIGTTFTVYLPAENPEQIEPILDEVAVTQDEEPEPKTPRWTL